jgi:hypothetical protein
MAGRDRKSTRAKDPSLANRAKKQEGARDRAVLADMGLGGLLSAEGSAPPAAVRRSSRPWRPPAAAQVARGRWLASKYPPPRPPAGSRRMDHLLRLMEPGRCYVLADLRRACTQLSRGSVHGFVCVKFIRYGYVERLPAPPGMAHRGPLMYGSPQTSPIRWLYRLTERGAEELRRVQEADEA